MARLHGWLFAAHNRIRFQDKAVLRDARSLNTQRLETGLKGLGRDMRFKDILQGSMAMHTMTKRVESDVDVDLAVVFRQEDLPSRALDARNLVLEALLRASPSSFSRPPSRRTNAITAWYSNGYHVDFAVHWKGPGGVLEHAGSVWTPSNPAALKQWFAGQVSRLSPVSRSSRVADGQLRRLVRLTKWAFGDTNGVFPGGYFITLLVTECYQPAPNGDDEALFRTLRELCSRLQRSTQVHDPVTGRVASARAKDQARIGRLGHELRVRLRAFENLHGRSRIEDWKAAWEQMLDL